MNKQMYPCLWFKDQAREAADFYCTIFPNSKVLNDSGMMVNFELDGKYFMGLNGGDNFAFTEAVSFVILARIRRKLTIIGTN
jgi:predicted 3-demethylubiquinone-9 3-methyltransferase (glyoxalase superfamily)